MIDSTIAIKAIQKNNKIDLVGKLSGEYVTLNDAIEAYIKFFYKIIQTEDALLNRSHDNHKSIENGFQVAENYRQININNEKVKKIRNILTIFPFELPNDSVIVPEMLGNVDYNVAYSNAKTNLKLALLGNFKIFDSSKEQLTEDSIKELIKKHLLTSSKLLLQTKVKKSALPNFLFDKEMFGTKRIDHIDEDLEKYNKEVAELYDKYSMYFQIKDLDTQKKLAEERTKAKEEKEREKKEKVEQLKMQILGILTTLDSMNDESIAKIQKYPVSKEVLFKTGDDGVIRIDERFIPVLKYIDLSGFGFENVDISGIDFSDCNVININPQKVFNKDLSNTIFIDDPKRPNNRFPFNASSNFEGVNLSGAQITIDKPIFINFKGSITDSKTLIQMDNKIIEINNNRKIV